MTVLNVATTEILDEEKMKAYIAAAAPLMEKFDAEVVIRGKYLKTLLGSTCVEHIIGVFRFKDITTAENFYSCEEYIDLIPLRDAAGNMTFNFYEE